MAARAAQNVNIPIKDRYDGQITIIGNSSISMHQRTTARVGDRNFARPTVDAI